MATVNGKRFPMAFETHSIRDLYSTSVAYAEGLIPPHYPVPAIKLDYQLCKRLDEDVYYWVLFSYGRYS